MPRLYDHQKDALRHMKNGCILCGDVGSGKSRTAIAYYELCNGASIDEWIMDDDDDSILPDLYIITTARKRDAMEWEGELASFPGLYNDDLYEKPPNITIDSWNNIKKYENAENAFFIFDEQRVVGKGAWVKSFLMITRSNAWILLSATPGDTWSDYIPVFIANGFYRNRTEFNANHVQYSRNFKYPKIQRYLNEGRLLKLRNQILIKMDFKRKTHSHNIDIWCGYDKVLYKDISRKRWNFFKEKPIETASEYCYCLREVCNCDTSRLDELTDILLKHRKVIVFYNYDYELDILKNKYWGSNVGVAEWNGHKHEQIPSEKDLWLYLVQYSAGAEGWNCIETDCIVFYSQSYSYKAMKQAAGRINRLNTPFEDLYFYYFKSKSAIDFAIDDALRKKKTFNENGFANW